MIIKTISGGIISTGSAAFGIYKEYVSRQPEKDCDGYLIKLSLGPSDPSQYPLAIKDTEEEADLYIDDLLKTEMGMCKKCTRELLEKEILRLMNLHRYAVNELPDKDIEDIVKRIKDKCDLAEQMGCRP